MSTPIAFEDIQVGDRIRIVDTYTADVDTVEEGKLTTDSGSRVFAPLYPGHHWDRSFELIDRPLPPLPTEPGSVILVEGERWFLQDDRAAMPRKWVNALGELRWPVSMKDHVEAANGFEVLL